MNKTNHALNSVFLFTTLIILLLCYWARIGLASYMSSIDYIVLFALAAIVFCLPDFLNSYFPRKNKWYGTSEFYTGLLIILLVASGIIISKHFRLTYFIVLPIGFALTLWQFIHFIRNRNLLNFAAGSIFMIFMVLLFYSQGYHSVLFTEKIVLGKAHLDTLFHSSMSNMFSTQGLPSTGLNGAPYIPYHWGSHALIAGLKNWSGLNSMMFYNIAYPAIFLPLFFKSFFAFLKRLSAYKGFRSLNNVLAIAFMTVLYSLPFSRFQSASPIRSESFCLAILFTFLFASVLLSYISDPDKNRGAFLSFSILTLLLISFFKISNGFVCFAAMAYLFLRTNWHFRSFLKVFLTGAALSAFVYFFIFPTKAMAKPFSLFGRVRTFWELSDGIITYLLGAFVAILAVYKDKSLASWNELKSFVKSVEYIDLEILFVMTLAGVAGGIYASINAADVYYFCSIQLFIAILYLILIAQKQFERMQPSKIVKTFFLFSVIILSVTSRTDVIKGISSQISGEYKVESIKGTIAELNQIKREMLDLTEEQKTLNDFIAELFKLDKMDDKKTKCLYVPQSEQWYYGSQYFRPFGSPLVAPAISGIAMIGGIPDNIFKTNIVYMIGHGYSYYKKKDQLMAANIDEAKNIAVKNGYNELIEFRRIKGNLIKRSFGLKPLN